MLGKFFDKILHEEEEVVAVRKKRLKRKKEKWTWLVVLILFVLAILPRIYFVFFVSNPNNPGAGWFGDAYHHWQIAYLTREVGLSHGFLRLWDLKGMEYFWGLLHPLFTMIAFAITGSTSIGVERAMTSLMGSISVVLIYLLGKKYWNTKVGIAAALFAALNPIGIFNDGTGMVEPVGIPFLLLSLYLWPRKPFLTGVSLVLALTARAEYWVFSLGILLAMFVLSGKKVKFDHKVMLFIGFIIPLVLYMKYLLDYTGNPIYPFYWNYVANIFGTWQLKPELTLTDLHARLIFRIILATSTLLAVFVIRKKPRGKYLYLLGLGNWIFLGATFGLGAYIKSYMNYVWYVRFMILPYAFLGIVLAVILFWVIPRLRFINIINKLFLNWVIFFVILLVIQPIWFFIWGRYSSTTPAWEQTRVLSNKIASNYHEGKLLLFEGNPEITYALVEFNNVEGKNIIGQMFDPFFYMDEKPFENWGENRETVLKWIKDNNVRTIATYVQSERYAKLAKIEPKYFSGPVAIPDSNIVIYQVNDKLYKEEI